MPDPAIAKVEDALAEVLNGYVGLDAYTVLTDQSQDVAIPEDADKTIVIFTAAYAQRQSDEQHQTEHQATIEIEVVSRTQSVGTINRANHTALAHIVAALGSDRTLGGRLLDLQEVDVAPAGANGRDVGSASLQVQAWFFTPRDDWFTILGQSGQQF